jgi:glycerol-3-phosphate acyltransferase PlsX
MNIAIDAMGGDYAPDEIVKGSIDAAKKFDKDAFFLVGDEKKLSKLIDCKETPNINIVHTDEYIAMDDNPSVAIRSKKRSSMKLAAELVSKKECDAMISAGNTGALYEVSLFTMGRIKGIKRPALAVLMPTKKEPCLLLDAGANADCKPEFLVQFARMGSIYMEKVFGIDKPKIGLLNIGEESGKGNQFYKQIFECLENESTINFKGNIEPKCMMSGAIDVLVADGFSGNIFLKSSEAAAEFMQSVLREEIKKSIVAKMASLTLKPIFKNMKKRLAHSEHGGALFLGLQGIVIKSHGSADARTIYNAARIARIIHEQKVQDFIGSIAVESKINI